MARNRPVDSSGRARPASGPKIDTPVLVVSMLTVFFATLFATLVLLRPRPGDSANSTQAVPQSAPSAPRVDTPPVDAPPPAPITRVEPKPGLQREPEPPAALRAELEQLGIKCAEGANCYPE